MSPEASTVELELDWQIQRDRLAAMETKRDRILSTSRRQLQDSGADPVLTRHRLRAECRESSQIEPDGA
jgi:hypothetical protein